jgi:hypothetical protein
MKYISNQLALLVAIACSANTMAAFGASDCGKPGTILVKSADGKTNVHAVTREFLDGSIAVRARLAVNPDGALASYTVGDAGFTYISNGMDRWKNGVKISCQKESCRSDFLLAENAGFSPGSPAFCKYAIEVDPYVQGGHVVSCGPGRSVIGDGKGKPKLGAQIKGVSGELIQTYLSTTSVRHLVAGQPQYLDSAVLPIAVTPRADLLGKVAWVGGRNMMSALALIGDIGPAFGEGSIALHQLLRWGKITPQQPGPIPVEMRCSNAELAIRAPFQSYPDAKNDRCRPGYKPRAKSDIRAYLSIEQPLDFVVLGKTGMLKPGSRLVRQELSTQALTEAATEYSVEEIHQMLSCLPK